ncbi:ion channel [Arthrobacter sp. Hiyo8]|nr:ion channel [Arthrobacter sp. Hiyo8]
MALFVRLLVWVIVFDLSFSLLLLPFVDGDLWQAASEAGSAMFTLGYAAPSNVGNTVLVYVAAYTGLIVIALQIGYLPTLYAAFNRREAEVTLLVSRAGSPSWGPELLVRTRFGMAAQTSTSELSELYQRWERWAADVAESHSTYLTLVWFRSPSPQSNWLNSLLSVMDAAALQLSLSPGSARAPGSAGHSDGIHLPEPSGPGHSYPGRGRPRSRFRTRCDL